MGVGAESMGRARMRSTLPFIPGSNSLVTHLCNQTKFIFLMRSTSPQVTLRVLRCRCPTRQVCLSSSLGRTPTAVSRILSPQVGSPSVLSPQSATSLPQPRLPVAGRYRDQWLSADSVAALTVLLQSPQPAGLDPEEPPQRDTLASHLHFLPPNFFPHPCFRTSKSQSRKERLERLSLPMCVPSIP